MVTITFKSIGQLIEDTGSHYKNYLDKCYFESLDISNMKDWRIHLLKILWNESDLVIRFCCLLDRIAHKKILVFDNFLIGKLFLSLFIVHSYFIPYQSFFSLFSILKYWTSTTAKLIGLVQTPILPGSTPIIMSKIESIFFHLRRTMSDSLTKLWVLKNNLRFTRCFTTQCLLLIHYQQLRVL